MVQWGWRIKIAWFNLGQHSQWFFSHVTTGSLSRNEGYISGNQSLADNLDQSTSCCSLMQSFHLDLHWPGNPGPSVRCLISQMGVVLSDVWEEDSSSLKASDQSIFWAFLVLKPIGIWGSSFFSNPHNIDIETSDLNPFFSVEDGQNRGSFRCFSSAALYRPSISYQILSNHHSQFWITIEYIKYYQTINLNIWYNGIHNLNIIMLLSNHYVSHCILILTY